ncbi:GNAT family N-acetyltransferase [Flammeovirga kamogawensis]|uniref:GNAT family N-acetyltransferase n=1 Tax=Flammeovirga kamogawensis TaxID=373891 RepID=A0ABX8GYY3_9BACT|nr:GNAT family N-acetyltransferase [Flammeovirga kamogawensis]MBB6459191.1 GNAT superfamily N-acetyltransferase [Flammeovirga kamogawensis]QWG08756.1 GNAT family N-acetyltransferase [Flammeovirga kamogawensis]TRX67049.1 GNAT family N-acetyltransferase [Flammeovirga kamogawensis]
MQSRIASSEDYKKIALLFDQYRIFYQQKSNLKGAEEFIKNRLENNESVIFIVEDTSHKMVGFVQLYPLFSSTRLQRLWLLNDLYVEETARGNGCSLLLINEAKKHAVATNSAGLILETEKVNEIGNNLYPRTGFQLDNEHNYYAWEPTKV